MAYLLIVGLTMFALPIGSIAIELHAGGASLLWLTGKWCIFWAVGARLLLAGLRQYFQPAFTSRDILGIEDPRVHIVVRELGGANAAAGIVGLASIALPAFVLPSAIGAGLFYAVAGLEHVKTAHRGRNENVAMGERHSDRAHPSRLFRGNADRYGAIKRRGGARSHSRQSRPPGLGRYPVRLVHCREPADAPASRSRGRGCR